MSTHPILILGGGINGAAAARELVLNGQSVWLVDAADLACGATAYSSRLIHGGLRYLEFAEFSLVKESLAERGRLLSLAPHLVKPLRLFIPVRNSWGGLTQAAGKFLGLPLAGEEDGPPRPARGAGWTVALRPLCPQRRACPIARSIGPDEPGRAAGQPCGGPPAVGLFRCPDHAIPSGW